MLTPSDVFVYLLVGTTFCLAAHRRISRQTDDRIYFEDDLKEYKNRIKTDNNNLQSQTNTGTGFGLPQKVLFVPEKVRVERQTFDFGQVGFNGIGQFPSRPNGEDDDVFIWGFQGPAPNRRVTKPSRRPQDPALRPQPSSTTPPPPSAVTNLPGPPAWATPPPSCVRNCQITPEYNPVCGTDQVTYSNPGRLKCVQRCGKSIEINFYGTCARTSEPAPSTTPRSRFG